MCNSNQIEFLMMQHESIHSISNLTSCTIDDIERKNREIRPALNPEECRNDHSDFSDSDEEDILLEKRQRTGPGDLHGKKTTRIRSHSSLTKISMIFASSEV